MLNACRSSIEIKRFVAMKRDVILDKKIGDCASLFRWVELISSLIKRGLDPNYFEYCFQSGSS